MPLVLVFDQLGHQAEVHGRWCCGWTCDCGAGGTAVGLHRAARAMRRHVWTMHGRQ